MRHTLDYLVSEPACTSVLQSLGQGRWHLTEEPALSVGRTFLDTFDWAIYRAGASLEWRDGPCPALLWRSLSAPETAAPLPLPARPEFAEALPEGPLRERLRPLARHRRLLPVMEIETRLLGFVLSEPGGSTVARLLVEESHCRDPQAGTRADLRPRLRLYPLHDSAEAAEALLAELGLALGLAPADRPPLLEALAACGRRPADYSPKIDFRIDPETRADQATREVLAGLFATIEANLAGTRANLDTEFLHDLRVATRRTRCALGQLRGVFPAVIRNHFKTEFAWLQAVTGPARDLDVYLAEFDAYQEALPPALRQDLEPLRGYLHAHSAAMRSGLVAALDSPRCARLFADWRDFLAAPLPPPGTTPNGARAIKPVADERIRALAKRVKREGRRIRADSPPEDLHELRKTCKKLRYLMEFFQSLYPREQIRGLIGPMKALLDSLGGFQDRTVQTAQLHDLGRRLRNDGQAPDDTLRALGALVGQLRTRQEQDRGDFDRVFGAFLTPEQQQGFRALFAGETPTG